MSESLKSEQDENLYDRYIKSGDDGALRVLLTRYRESLTLFINGYIHDLEEAEDIMLDAFVAISIGKAKYTARGYFKTWLFSIGRNLAISHLRKQKFHLVSLSDNEEYESDESPDFEMLKEERNRELYSAMSQLKDEYRQVLFLLYFEEMSEDEAAIIMKKSKKQVYDLAYRSKNALKGILEKEGFEYAQY